MFVGLRQTELPWYLYWIYWFGGLGAAMQMFGVGHDVMFAKQDSAKIVQKLKSPVCGGLEKFSRAKRRDILKRSEAIQSLRFRVAAFTNYSWTVPWRAWYESLNQFLFFLSL